MPSSAPCTGAALVRGGRAASLRPLWCHQPAMALAALEKRALVLALGDHGRAPGEGAGAPQPRVQAEGQPPGPQHPLASCRCQAGPWGGLWPQGCTLPALPPPAGPSQGCGCPWGGQRITREGLLRAQPQPQRQSAGGVWLETPARGRLWGRVQGVPGVRAGLGWEGRCRGWAGRDPAREMMYGQMYQIAQDKQAVNFIRAHHGFNLAA